MDKGEGNDTSQTNVLSLMLLDMLIILVILFVLREKIHNLKTMLGSWMVIIRLNTNKGQSWKAWIVSGIDVSGYIV